MKEEYKAIQELDGVDAIEIGSFKEEIFKTSSRRGMLGEGIRVEEIPVERSFKLFSGELYDVLHFSYSFDGGKSLYIRFKERNHIEQDIYCEMHNTGMSSCGGKESGVGHNPWAKYVKEFRIYTDGKQLLLDTGGSSFEILQEVTDPNRIEEELSRGYAKLPTNVVSIQYMCHNDNNEVYCLTNSEFHYGIYERLRILNLKTDKITEANISNHGTYRDGGTTYINFEVDGVEKEFFYPTLFGKVSDHPSPKITKIFIDGNPVEYLTYGVSKSIYDHVVNKLGLILEVKNDRKYVPMVVERHEYDSSES